MTDYSYDAITDGFVLQLGHTWNGAPALIARFPEDAGPRLTVLTLEQAEQEFGKAEVYLACAEERDMYVPSSWSMRAAHTHVENCESCKAVESVVDELMATAVD